MADNDPVIAPDQLKPGSRKWSTIGAVGSAVILLLMIIGNHEGNVENVWLISIAALLLIIVGVDAGLRRNGLR
ncbi:MAG TPA: DUF2631 domain-containing protein [Actinoplanes sp.]